MTRARTAVCILLTLATAAVLPAAALGAEPQPDEDWQREDRRLVVGEARDDRVRLESARDSNRGTDRVTVEFHRDDARVLHRFTTHDAAAADGTDQTVSLRLLSLIEFHPPGDDAHFGPGAVELQRHRIIDLEPEPLRVDSVAGGQRIVAAYTVPDRRDGEETPLPGGLTDGRLTITLTMSGRARTVDGETVTPTEARFDVRIERHPFQETETRLALEYEVASDRPLASAAAHRDALLVAATPYESYVGWDEQAVTGPQRQPVAVTLLSRLDATGGESGLLYLSIAQALNVEHAQTLGTLRLTGLPEAAAELVARGDLLVYGGVLLVTLIAVGAPVARRLRDG